MMSVKKYNAQRPESVKFAKFYVAYGSNMDLNQMICRCTSARFYATGMLENYRLLFKQSFATVEPEQGMQVPVVLFRITEEDEQLLDVYEGYPRLYFKKEVQIKIPDKNELVSAMIYIMHDLPWMLPRVSYYENMEMCYKTFGFDKSILESALIYSYLNTDKNISVISSAVDLMIDETPSSSKYTAVVLYSEDTADEKKFSNFEEGVTWIKYKKNLKDDFVEGLILDTSTSDGEPIFYIDQSGNELNYFE